MPIKRKTLFNKIVFVGAFLDKHLGPYYRQLWSFVLCTCIDLEILQFMDFLDVFDLLSPKIILNNRNTLLLWDCIPWNVYLIRRDCTWHGAHTSPPTQQDEDPFTAAAWLMTLTCEVTEFMLWCCWRLCCNMQASLYWVTRLIKLLKMTMFRTKADKQSHILNFGIITSLKDKLL
jgi:hypothetical protein